jgi:ABC-type branched-subunit amino acid transport system substrate-binding protein
VTRKHGARRAIMVGTALALLAGCGSTTKSESTTTTTTTGSTTTTGAPGTTAAGVTSTTAGPATTVPLTASFRGVTADSIKIGFPYIDLEALAKSGLIKISHGPYADIIKALVDDVNASGGVNGRKLELVSMKYSAIGSTEQLADCTKLTEDEKVFAVLNGFTSGQNDLCVTQQHSTIMIDGQAISDATRAKATAPWVTWIASTDRLVSALVKVLDTNGTLKGHTIGIYAVADQSAEVAIAKKALTDAGYTVADTEVNDTTGTDVQASNAKDKVIAQHLSDSKVDVLIDIAQSIPGANFDAVGYHPSIFNLYAGNIAAAAFTNPLGKFPTVAGLQAGSADDAYASDAFKQCMAIYKKASGVDVVTPEQEDLSGKSSGFVGLMNACTALDIFVAAAKAAGPNLTNDTFKSGLESLGKISLPNTPAASFGPNKDDGQDSFQLFSFDPTWKQGSGKPQYNAVGSPITLGN